MSLNPPNGRTAKEDFIPDLLAIAEQFPRRDVFAAVHKKPYHRVIVANKVNISVTSGTQNKYKRDHKHISKDKSRTISIGANDEHLSTFQEQCFRLAFRVRRIDIDEFPIIKCRHGIGDRGMPRYHALDAELR